MYDNFSKRYSLLYVCVPEYIFWYTPGTNILQAMWNMRIDIKYNGIDTCTWICKVSFKCHIKSTFFIRHNKTSNFMQTECTVHITCTYLGLSNSPKQLTQLLMSWCIFCTTITSLIANVLKKIENNPTNSCYNIK